CSFLALERYRHRISGPILDRVDLQVRVGHVTLADLRSSSAGESSEAIGARVKEARLRQAHRLAHRGILLNAEMSSRRTRDTCRLNADGETELERLPSRRPGLTARALERIVRTARTIADLDGRDEVDADAVIEAALFRSLDTEPLADPRHILRR